MRQPVGRLFVALALSSSVVACGQTPVGPSAQAPVTTTTIPNLVLTGRLTSSITGAPLSGATVDLDGRSATSGDDGRFRYELAPGTFSLSPRVRISGTGILERSLWLSVTGARDLSLDAVTVGDGFDLAYYRQLVRDDHESPGLLRTLRRWNQAPRLYIKTLDELGQPIDPTTFNTVVGTLQEDASVWTGGRFGLAGVELGTDTREGVSGWITVKWANPVVDQAICARAQIAVNGGWIEFNHLRGGGCGCRGSLVGTKTIRHELGHALGFWHTGDPTDVMYPGAVCEDRRPSARERLHGGIAYGRSFGNIDPDVDPSSVFQRHEPPVVVVD